MLAVASAIKATRDRPTRIPAEMLGFITRAARLEGVRPCWMRSTYRLHELEEMNVPFYDYKCCFLLLLLLFFFYQHSQLENSILYPKNRVQANISQDMYESSSPSGGIRRDACGHCIKLSCGKTEHP